MMTTHSLKPRPYVVLGLEKTPGSMPMGKGKGPHYFVGPGGSLELELRDASVFAGWQDADDVAQDLNRELAEQGFHFWAWPDYFTGTRPVPGSEEVVSVGL